MLAAGVRLGELDLLSGGPPCQTFSTAGNRMSMTNPRGSLVGRFLELVSDLQPRFFILENVRGILSAAIKHRPLAERGPDHPPLSPDEQPGSLLEEIILPWMEEKLDYQVSYGLVNAADYGVPQVRQRVIFIGSRDHEFEGGGKPDLADLIRATHAKEPGFGQKSWRSLREALEALPPLDTEGARYSLARAAVMERIPEG